MQTHTHLEWAVFIFIITACLFTASVTIAKLISKEIREKRSK